MILAGEENSKRTWSMYNSGIPNINLKITYILLLNSENRLHAEGGACVCVWKKQRQAQRNSINQANKHATKGRFCCCYEILTIIINSFFFRNIARRLRKWRVASTSIQKKAAFK